ncbi:MAG: S41 family peptidase [Gammaproteobacteria bacterium]|nr:S41 family peptidase [Gammaproteobacteria bacterium]
MRLRPLTLVGIAASMTMGVALGVVAFQELVGELRLGRDATSLGAVVQRVRDAYVEPIDEQTLTENAIRGIVDGLDRHSSYLDAAALADLREETTGNFGGIGVDIGLENGYITVIRPLDDTPAARAGLHPGDTLIEVDHKSLRGRTLRETVKDLRGEPGTEVHVRLRRDGVQMPMDFDLVRAAIRVSSVRSRLIEPGYGYVRIAQFQNKTPQDLREAVQRLADESEGGLRGLVVDLRNNPGGVLGASVDVADEFLDGGLIVYTEGRDEKPELRFLADDGDILEGAPLVVLINRGSASAAEVVAGALQDHGRATLVGTKSYGKGSVQSVLRLQGKRAIKLTTAHYYTPNGRSIQASGIDPDIVVPIPDGDSSAGYDALLLARAMRQLKESPRQSESQGVRPASARG